MTTTTATPASDKQIAFLNSLLAEKDLTGTEFLVWTGDFYSKQLTKREASDAITALLALPKAQTATPAAPAARQELSEGMWLVGPDVATGRIFKVQKSQHSDRLYAKELIDGSFEYVPGAARLLATEGRKLTLEEAKEYGALYGTCCVCGRTLSNPDSVEAGIGPICAGRF